MLGVLQLRQPRSHRLRGLDRDDMLAEAIDATPDCWPCLAVPASPNHEEVEVGEHLLQSLHLSSSSGDLLKSLVGEPQFDLLAFTPM